MNVDAEIADKNVERDLRLGSYQNVISIVTCMVEIKAIADAEIEPQGVQLCDRPNGIECQIRRDDNVVLRMRADDSRAKGTNHNGAAVVRIVDVIVVLDPDAGPDSKSNWPQEQIVRNTGDIFLSRIRRRLARQ